MQEADHASLGQSKVALSTMTGVTAAGERNLPPS